ncbi:hypothetical protein EMIT0232MI5_30263 [Pseudomonas sp. IT-232MI5]
MAPLWPGRRQFGALIRAPFLWPLSGVFDLMLSRVRRLGWVSKIHPPSPQPSPQRGEGEREPIFMLFKTYVRLDVSGRRTLPKRLGQSPLPLGGPTFREG